MLRELPIDQSRPRRVVVDAVAEAVGVAEQNDVRLLRPGGRVAEAVLVGRVAEVEVAAADLAPRVGRVGEAEERIGLEVHPRIDQLTPVQLQLRLLGQGSRIDAEERFGPESE